MTTATLTHNTTSPQATAALGAAVARCARPGDILALIGELGAGKTQFVRGLAEGMNIDPDGVSSPTFVLVQEYEAEESDEVLVHIDAYRIEHEADLTSIGWGRQGEELAHDAVVVVEWANLIEKYLPADRLEIHLKHAADGRSIALTCHGDWRKRQEDLAEALKTA